MDRTFAVESTRDCAAECVAAYDCATFSFNLLGEGVSCRLSSVTREQLRVDTDLVTREGWDVFWVDRREDCMFGGGGGGGGGGGEDGEGEDTNKETKIYVTYCQDFGITKESHDLFQTASVSTGALTSTTQPPLTPRLLSPRCRNALMSVPDS